MVFDSARTGTHLIVVVGVSLKFREQCKKALKGSETETRVLPLIRGQLLFFLQKRKLDKIELMARPGVTVHVFA